MTETTPRQRPPRPDGQRRAAAVPPGGRPAAPAPDDEFFTELSWRVLVEPNDTKRPGTMSAGMVLVVMAAAMLIAMLVNATAIKHRSESKNAGTWRYNVANVVETFASTLQLTSPRSAIDAALGRETQSDLDDVDTGEIIYAEAPEGPTGTDVASMTPVLREPTTASPLRMHISGDSIVGIFGNQLKKQATDTGLITAELDYRPSTGLSRPDFFNWPKHLNEVNASDDPEVLVLMFGANDIQGMRVGESAVQPGTPEWYAEYRKRVGGLMESMRDPDNDRMVLWVGALPMGPNSGVGSIPEVDYIYATEAAKRPWVTYVDSWPFFVDGSGAYQPELPDAAGEGQLLRERDNIHLTAAGGDRLASMVLARLAELVPALEPELAATPAQRAPSEITERDEVPKPDGFPDGV
ncbi:MAG: hypothetical protein R2699_04765 [Acidimicrobiales bacterium]